MPSIPYFWTMFSIVKKEFRQYFSSLTGLIAIAVFLLLSGLFLFVFPDSNVLDFGYASLDSYFQMAPWILTFLIPAITMRSFADEYKMGTYEILQTRPLTHWGLILGKYFGTLAVVAVALLPTVLYAFSIQQLSESTGIDRGATIGSYLGLFLLAAVFTSIGLWCSSFTQNAVVAFIISAFACFLLYTGFETISKIPVFQSGADYYIEKAGIAYHYKSISKGVIDSRDLVYFLTVISFFLYLTYRNLLKKTK